MSTRPPADDRDPAPHSKSEEPDPAVDPDSFGDDATGDDASGNKASATPHEPTTEMLPADSAGNGASAGKGDASWTKWLLIGFIAIVGLGLAYYMAGGPLPNDEPIEIGPPVTVTVEAAQQALTAEDYPLALHISQQLLADQPDSREALLIAGEASLKLGLPVQAIDFWSQIKDDGSDGYIQSLWATAQVYMFLGRLSDAEALYREVLRRQPGHPIATERLAFLLNVEGRRWEAMPYLLDMIRQQAPFSIEHLILLGNLDGAIDKPELLELAREAAPDDVVPLIGDARIDFEYGRHDEALEHLDRVLAEHPEQIEAQSLKGQILVNRGDNGELESWRSNLPEGAERHPEIWFVQGVWAQNQGYPDAAARCFWEAIRRDPAHQRANYRLAQLLQSMDRHEDAQVFLEQAQALERVTNAITPIYESGPDLARMVTIARTMNELGRLWESFAWYRWILAMHPEQTTLRQEVAEIAERLENDPPPRVLDELNPAEQVVLSDLALPDWSQVASGSASPAARTVGSVPVRFREVASAAGIAFTFENGDDPNETGLQIYQELGGGIAVLDFDLDGWQDLYFSQGSAWPPDPGQTVFRDRLYRNQGDGTFVDVTSAAGLGDNAYSQGVTVGDFDNDGYPDLYVANIGLNRLYRNQGDGTFVDVTETAGLTLSLWSTSVLLADVNGDGLPDLYDVNYLAGREPFERVCHDGDRPRACAPNNFSAALDRLFLNRGDGTFEDVTATAGINGADGKGLGIVAADFGGGKLDLFVANDTTGNHYYVNQGEPGQTPQFTEQALLRGLAYDRDGVSQACMGIAIEDLNGDGLFDLFVTNFWNESNTFYRQLAPDFFSDETRATGLREPSLPVLGFGTQFLDADLDGRPDLVVTNGHVDDYTDQGTPFRMAPQFFHHGEGEQFAQVEAADIGPYFERELLGRSLVRLDWNRDGLPEFAVMHLYDPLALMQNTTETSGHYVKLHLRGTERSRDAIGARIQLRAGGRDYVRQLTAGDGYQASNERTIHVGLGDADSIEQMTVLWPGGAVQEWQDVPVDQEWMIVEGREPVVVPR